MALQELSLRPMHLDVFVYMCFYVDNLEALEIRALSLIQAL